MQTFLRHFGPAVLSGLLLFLAFPRLHGWLLAWVALVPLLWRAQAFGPRQAAGHFFIAGWLFHTLLLQWLVTNIFWAGGWAILGQQILCAALALFWAGAGYTWAWLNARTPRLAPLAFAFVWVAMEWGQANLFSGFGWSALGYSQAQPVIQLAALGSVHLISFTLVLVNALLAGAVTGLKQSRRPRLFHLAAAVAAIAVAIIAGALMLPATVQGSGYRVGIVQTNFPQEMKWDHEYQAEMINKSLEYSQILLQPGPLDLIVWPEATIMSPFDIPGRISGMQQLARDHEVALFAGAVRAGGSGNYNSSVLIDRQGNVAGYYDKVHLAPYGEYVPYSEYMPFLEAVVPGGGVDAGEKQQVLHHEDHKLGPLICFEVLFSGMAQALRSEGADYLVVVTNLAWFGMSNAIPQELELARMRAIETRLPLIHAANTGISGVFDPWGRFTPVNAYASLAGDYREVGVKPFLPQYTLMQRMIGRFELPAPAPQPLPFSPLLFPWAACGAALACLIAVALRARMAARNV